MTSSRSAALHLESVGIRLNGQLLFEPVTVSVEPGDVVALMGPSGCGKSSLLAWLCGSLPAAFAAEGHAMLGAQDLADLAPESRQLGILFQDDLLFPHMSVGENLAFALRPGFRRRDRRAKVAAALEEAELAGFADRDPATLSGGQRARVALMRALLAEPRALLLDEPFSRLDAGLRRRVRHFVFDHAKARRLPILLVTHDPEDAEATDCRIVRLAASAPDLAPSEPDE